MRAPVRFERDAVAVGRPHRAMIHFRVEGDTRGFARANLGYPNVAVRFVFKVVDDFLAVWRNYRVAEVSNRSEDSVSFALTIKPGELTGISANSGVIRDGVVRCGKSRESVWVRFHTGRHLP